VVRRQGSQWLGILRCGAATADEARGLADAYLARHGVVGEWTKTIEGYRPKIGVAGYRRFDVIYRLAGRP
jgi:hypothetical protein